MKIGKRVAKLRYKAKLTQKELAEKAGVGDRTVRNIESCNRQITLLSLKKVCLVLGYTVEYTMKKVILEEV